MRKSGLIAAAVFVLAAGAAGADPLEGTWQTSADDNGNYGHIQVSACGDAFCGVLTRSFGAGGAEIESENIGKRIIWDMKALGGGKYGRGKIWSPDRDQVYNSKMTLGGDTVNVKGCVLIICRDGGTWHRVNN